MSAVYFGPFPMLCLCCGNSWKRMFFFIILKKKYFKSVQTEEPLPMLPITVTRQRSVFGPADGNGDQPNMANPKQIGVIRIG